MSWNKIVPRLAKERRNLDQDLKQLREDEESLEVQMRQMEVQMARERAMMARQETELKRLSADKITHQLEIMQRGDGALRVQSGQIPTPASGCASGIALDTICRRDACPTTDTGAASGSTRECVISYVPEGTSNRVAALARRGAELRRLPAQ